MPNSCTYTHFETFKEILLASYFVKIVAVIAWTVKLEQRETLLPC